MSYHIQIQGIRPNAQVRELFEYLEKLTGDTTQTLIAHLKSPPFDLPDQADQGLLQRHLVEIRKLGGVARIQQAKQPGFAENKPAFSTTSEPEVESTSKIAEERRRIAEAYQKAENEKDEKSRREPKPSEDQKRRPEPNVSEDTKKTKPAPIINKDVESPTNVHSPIQKPNAPEAHRATTLVENVQHSQPLPHHENSKTKPNHHHDHELPSPFAASGKRKKKPQQSQLKTIVILIAAVMAFIAISVYVSNQPSQSSSREKATSNSNQNFNAANKSTQNPKTDAPKKSLQQRKQQTREANSLYEKSKRANNPQQKEELLHQTVKKNPYHSKAWEDLVQNLRKNGKFEQAEKMEKQQQEQNLKVRKALKSIAETFGTEGQKEVDINPARVNVSVSSNQSMKPQEFYQRGFGVWQQVNQKHPDKEFELNRTGRSSYSMQTKPGADYPAYQEWKTKQR